MEAPAVIPPIMMLNKSQRTPNLWRQALREDPSLFVTHNRWIPLTVRTDIPLILEIEKSVNESNPQLAHRIVLEMLPRVETAWVKSLQPPPEGWYATQKKRKRERYAKDPVYKQKQITNARERYQKLKQLAAIGQEAVRAGWKTPPEAADSDN